MVVYLYKLSNVECNEQAHHESLHSSNISHHLRGSSDHCVEFVWSRDHSHQCQGSRLYDLDERAKRPYNYYIARWEAIDIPDLESTIIVFILKEVGRIVA